MRTKAPWIILIIIGFVSVSFLFQGCGKDEDKEEAKFTEVNSEFADYIGIANTKEIIGFKVNPSTDLPTDVFYQHNTDPGIHLRLTNEGLPDMLYHNGVFVIYRNIREDLLDVGVVTSNGEVEIFRDIEFDASFFFSDEFYNFTKGTEGWKSTTLKVVGHSLNLAKCVAGIMATKASAGITLSLAKLFCASFITGVTMDAAAAIVDNQEFSNFCDAVGVVNISTPGDVIVTIGSVVSRMESDEQEQAGNINSASAALYTGHGDIQFTLTWNSVCDLDLWVTDPTGFKIIYYDPVSPSGGQLDYDNTYGYGPENIFWPSGMAPAGDYLVQVDYYSGTGVSNYTVLVTTSGGTQSFSGSISPDETHTVATITLGGSKIQSVEQPNIVEAKQGNRIPK